MKLSEYIKAERGRASLLAKAIKAHAPDVSRWALDPSDQNYRPIPIRFGAAIEIATNGLVSRKDNFDDWEKIWPELIEQKAA